LSKGYCFLELGGNFVNTQVNTVACLPDIIIDYQCNNLKALDFHALQGKALGRPK